MPEKHDFLTEIPHFSIFQLNNNQVDIENEFVRNDRGPLPDPEVNDLIPDIAVDDLRKRIFLEGRQQPVKSSNEEDVVSSVLEQNVLLGDQSVDPEQLAYILIGKKNKKLCVFTKV